MKKFVLPIATILLINTLPAVAAEHEVGQKNKAFTAKELRIKVGDSVKFTNQDPFFHNVYSLSDLKTFDLGSYPKGEFRSVVFDKAGKVPVECAIHPNMYMGILVEK
ncbi:methylamine utilization protein [endosymbiont of Ridgeia piscesae]|jgi:plastocyanin|uniref:Plastocyanin n=1 Tax=endosymbiont of Ridgeia piscesae TaxID=54398 RepID=A0A0T5Z295_9GAMM|nr:methylamine utilization protein [endosymbiont of Ridgeia piscesae]KRT55991.1 Plastocyanin [endosymbiont of Ridgeia piscesae]KRT56986.1 Plastocyanin [endosymbiont of Ridgeia piscesae]